VRNRRARITREIADTAEELGATARPLRFMSVACGPAWELRDLFCERADLERYECVLLDQDEEALLEAEAGVRAVERRLEGDMRGQIIRDSVRTMLREADLSERWGRFHLIYSMGLFDYLTQPVARAVVERLYELLHHGGKLIIGNFHVGNPTRQYMAYWMDWTLIYRTEDSLGDLALSLPGASISIGFEQTRSQMFMTVRKP
jgi:extracellular factor (EF) 3-hydroxypalmitic acid methyl ester biosynthesis protein